MKLIMSSLSAYYGSIFKTSSMWGMRFASSAPVAHFDPYFSEGSRIIIPISFSRYVVRDDISIKRAKEYDSFLNTIFERTAYILRSGLVARVDILSSGDLQRIYWGEALTNKVEQHFLHTHADMLARQSDLFTLDCWINSVIGVKAFEERYNRIVAESSEGSEWYDLMLRTYSSLKTKSRLEQSVEYQRKEYTAMSLMHEYTHLVYAGPMSIAWAYLYKKYPEMPMFSQVKVEKLDESKPYIKAYDAEQTTKFLLTMLKDVLTNSQFPPEKKELLVDSCMGLLYAYGHPKNKCVDQLTNQENTSISKRKP